MACKSHERAPRNAYLRNRLGAGMHREGIRGLLDREQRQSRGEQILLPRVRSDGIAEIGLVVAAAEPIGASLLLVGPADGQLLEPAHLVEDDRPLRDGRPDDRVALLPEAVDDPAQVGLVDDELSVPAGATPPDPGIDATSIAAHRSGSMTVNIQQLHPGGLQPLGDHVENPSRQKISRGGFGVAELAEPDSVESQGPGRLDRTGRRGLGRWRKETTSRRPLPAPR